MKNLEGKVAIITGGARGLGLEYALRLASLGASVAVCDKDLASAAEYEEDAARLINGSVEETLKATGARALARQVDVTDKELTKVFVEETYRTFGRIDVVVCNAGGGGNFSGCKPSELDEETTRSTIDRNFMSTVFTVTAAAPYMKEQRSGKFVNISSFTGTMALGTGFGADFYGVQPDMLNFAKCVTNGVMPMGGVICTDRIYDAMMGAHGNAPDHAIEFFHGYTYSGHPVACAAALATLDLYKQENLFERAGQMGQVLGDAMHSAIKGLPHVIGIRSLGLACAVELAPMPGMPGKRAFDVFMDCFHKGVLVRNAGENLVFAPPYIVEREHIETMVSTLADAIRRLPA